MPSRWDAVAEVYDVVVREPRLERLQALLQPAGHVHDAFEHGAVSNVGQVDVDVDSEVGIGGSDLGPSLEATGADVEVDLVTWQRVTARTPPRREVKSESVKARKTSACDASNTLRWRAAAFFGCS